MTLTKEEVLLMQELAEGERTISGTEVDAGLKLRLERLIEAGYLIEERPTRGDMSLKIYRMTDAGREALRAA